jgi:flagellar biogenesis protein FliO
MTSRALCLSAASLAALLSASLPAPVAAAPARSLYSAPAKPASPRDAAEPAADEPAPAPTPAMEEKFRKLQREMQGESSAVPAPGKAAAPASEGGSVGGIALQILFGLAFVLLLAVVSIRVLKRMQGRLLSRPGKGGDMLEVLETCHLGPQQKVVAIRLHEDVGILGVTKENVHLLTVLKQSADDVRTARRGESNSAAFSDNLNKLLERFKKPKKVSDMLEEGQG